MNRITRKTDYAIRILLALARREPGQRVPTAEIVSEMAIPLSMAGQLVAELAHGGFVQTQAGRDGGIQLARAPQKINLLQVIEHMEGPVHLSDCIEGDYDCVFSGTCPVQRQWLRVDRLVNAALEKITFEQLVAEGD